MKIITLFLLLGIFVACESKAPENFGDFVDITKIDKVIMHNNSGDFMLNDKELEMFKRELEILTPATGAYKTGAITMTLTIKKKEYLLSTNTNGEYIECPAALLSSHKDYFGNREQVYFKTNGVNFDNFQP